jgi:hypothetical protein
MLQIPIQAVPSQVVLCVLANQNCQISIYQKGDNVFVDLNSNGVDMCIGCLGLNGVPLDACNAYDGFQGNLYFVDTQGLDDPDYTGFNTRWYLVYLTAAEVALTGFIPDLTLSVSSLMTLSATLTVTSPGAGNFSVAHGLVTVPVLIEIQQTDSGAIWGQAGFADETNINLVASDVGVTATLLVFTSAALGLEVQEPHSQLFVASTGYEPFPVAHGLSGVPSLVEILPTFFGALWQTAPPDATNLYFQASDVGITALVSVYEPVSGAFNLNGPATSIGVTSTSPGLFSIPHGLTAIPSRIEILMLSGGEIIAQTPGFDGAYVYLSASDAGVIAKILVYP